MNRKITLVNHNFIAATLLFLFSINFAMASLSEDLQLGGLVVLGDTPDEDDLGYLHISIDPENDTLQFQSFALDLDTLEFVEVEGGGDDEELILTSDGWQQNPMDYVVSEFNGNSFSAMNSVNESIAISGIPLNIQNQTFAEFIATLAASNEGNDDSYLEAFYGFSIILDPAFIFSDSAEAYSMEIAALDDAYFLWTSLGCANRIDNECDYTNVQNSAQQNGAINSLDNLFAASEWDGTNPAQLITVQIAWGQTGVLLAEFVSSETSSGVVNYYIRNHTNNSTNKISQGQWQREQNQGTDLVRLALSNELLSAAEGLVDIDTTQLLFSVFGGYVRNGSYDLAGQVFVDDPEIWLNSDALEQLTGALFSGGNLAEDLQNGGIAILGTAPEDNELGYELITTNQENANLQFQSFVLNPQTLEFVEVEDNSIDDELVLTTDGWIPSPNDYFVTGLNGNSISVDNSAGESLAVTGILLNLQNISFAEFVVLFLDLDDDSYSADDIWQWAYAVDPEFSFSGAAAVYLTNLAALSESFYLWTTAQCSDRIDGDCWYTYVQNTAQQNSAINSLDELFVAPEWDSAGTTPLIAAHIAWGEAGVLMAEFVASESTSGVVNFYLHNYNNNTIDKMGEGQWQRELNKGVELVLLELSEPLLDAVENLVYIESSQLLFSVYGGYVRSGGYYLAGQLDDTEQEIWFNNTALQQIKNALVFNPLDSDGDGVNDSDDAFPNDPTESVDTDGDLIGNNADTDDDGDQYLDADEIAAGSDPLDGQSLPLDTDGDYISDATDPDDDNDGVSDVDELAHGSDPLDRNSVPQNITLLTFDDVTGDGVADWLGYEVKTSEVKVNVFSGDDFLSMGSFTFAHGFEAAQLHKLGDRDDDGISELGVFGFNSALNRYQLFVHNGVSGQKLGTWNWPATLVDAQLEILADLTNDGIQEYAIQGIHETNGTRQLVVKNGATRAGYQTFKWPNLWDNTRIVTLSDRSGDGIPEIGLYGRHMRIDKGQLFVFDGASATTRLDVYNWNKIWTDIQLIKMDDVDGEGTIDWGQFGKRKDDGRYQWVIKKGHDKRGVIRTFSWQADLENVTPLLVADRTNDGIREVAIVGTHEVSGRILLRINDGKLANQRIANISWPANWEDLQVKELGDLNDDGFNEYAMLGYLKSNRTVQLVVKDGQTLTEYGRYTFEGDWEALLLSSTDVNGDGIADVMVSGLEQVTGLRKYVYLDGINMELLWQR